MTELRQAAQQVLDAWDSPLWKTGTTAAKIADLRTALAMHQVSEFAQAQEQAEPVAWMDREGDLYKMPEIKNWAPPHTMLYTTPPQRQWVGLTDEEVQAIWKDIIGWGDPSHDDEDLVRAIEAKLKERNHD